MSRGKLFLVAVTAQVCLGAQLRADLASTTYNFYNITANNVNSAAIGEAQLSVKVSEVADHADQALFTFLNSGPEPCSITDVYFDDGALLGIAQLTGSSGVSFSQGASPGDLPGGEAVGFQVSQGFSADSDHPHTMENGVNHPEEWLGVLFNLKDQMTYGDVIAAIELGLAEGGVDNSLRIGIHVQGFDGDWSEAYVNTPPVPAPAAVTLGLIGLGLLGLLQRRWLVS